LQHQQESVVFLECDQTYQTTHLWHRLKNIILHS